MKVVAVVLVQVTMKSMIEVVIQFELDLAIKVIMLTK